MHTHQHATVKTYAGIGNRDAPEWVLEKCYHIARILGELGYTLRSGGADGCDSAFQGGASQLELYVPWDRFNGIAMRYGIAKKAFELAASYVNKWTSSSKGVQALHARNMMQIMGPYLDCNSDFVICYTRDGCQSKAERTIDTGGTGSAIALADDNGIPIINIANPGWAETLSVILGQDLLHLEDPNQPKPYQTP